MAEEQQYFRVKLVGKGSPINELQSGHQLIEEDANEDLISVSDNQDDDDEDEGEYSEESASECDEDDDDEYNVDEEQHVENSNNIDILNLGLINHDNLGLDDNQQSDENNMLDLNDGNEDFDLSNEQLDSDSTSTIDLNNIKTIHLEEVITLDEPDLSSEFNMDDHDNDHDNNTINTFDTHSKQEYKKMSLNKLREVAVEKGVIQDASKLKKNEILKLLGDE